MINLIDGNVETLLPEIESSIISYHDEEVDFVGSINDLQSYNPDIRNKIDAMSWFYNLPSKAKSTLELLHDGASRKDIARMQGVTLNNFNVYMFNLIAKAKAGGII